MNGTTIKTAPIDELSDSTRPVEFGRSHNFGAFLNALKDPEYEFAGMGQFADRVVSYLKHAAHPTADLPLVVGELHVSDKETSEVITVIEFIWAHCEKALHSLGYCRPAETFIPLLRDNEDAPLLRISDLRLDGDYFGEWASGGYRSLDGFEFTLECSVMQGAVNEEDAPGEPPIGMSAIDGAI